MKKRSFANLGFDVSPFGFGAMRLPANNGEVDVPESIRMIHRAIDGGVNYFDTAYVYCKGQSEVYLGKALEGGLRDKVRIATKLATWHDTPDRYEAQLDESLKKLQTDHLDFYLFHAIDEDRWNKYGEAVCEFMTRMVEKGKILYPSFSYHDGPEFFKKVIDAYDWKMTQVQINYLDADATNQASMEGVKYAASKGVAVVSMEPLRGGNLAKTIPPEVQTLFDNFPVKRSPVEWAFRYLYDKPEIYVHLSGVSTMEQLEDNLRIFADVSPNCMSPEEDALIESVVKAYKSRIKAGCTGCEYCMPCPAGVNIPGVLRSWDESSIYDNPSIVKGRIERLSSENAGPAQCVECGACEPQCPQHIEIIQKLKEAASAAE